MSDTENTQQTDDTQKQEPVEFDAEDWFNQQPDELRAAIEKYTQHRVAPLKETLGKERKDRRTFEQQVKELSARAAGNPELEKQLQEMSQRLATEERRANFLDEAAKRNVNPNRFTTAFKLAQADGLIDDNGQVDWDGLKSAYPELYVTEQKPKGSGGAGTGLAEKPKPAQDMNARLRRAAGR